MAHIQRVPLKRSRDGKRKNSYRVRYVDLDRRERMKSFPTKAAAEDFAAKVHTETRDGSFVDPARGKMAFEVFASEWLKTKANRKPKTISGYQSILDKHIYPKFGKRSLSSIRAMEIDALLADMERDGLSGSRQSAGMHRWSSAGWEP